MRTCILLGLGAFLLLFAACDRMLTADEDAIRSLSDTTWTLLAFNPGDGAEAPVDSGEVYTVRFAPEQPGASSEMYARANAVLCEGLYQTKPPNAIRMHLACVGLPSTGAAQFAGALEVADAYELRGGELRIYYTVPSSGERAMLRFAPGPVDNDLWMLH